jgi:glycosyltransferase involved in cell wall biosynthesis
LYVINETNHLPGLKRVYLSVINDLVADQRVHRTAITLAEQGAAVMLIGRCLPGSLDVTGRPYQTRRFRMLFKRGFLFYACFNLRLFLFLLFARKGVLGSNDLDTLPANFLVSHIRKMPLVYDSHEYFTEVPELIDRPFVRKFWLWIEKKLVPGLHFASTVSQGVADEYYRLYNQHFVVIRNLPVTVVRQPKKPELLNCGKKRIIIYQGSLNPGRGIDHMIRAMEHLDRFVFQVFGDGPLRGYFEDLAGKHGVKDRVIFMGVVPFAELRAHTRQASIGISLEEKLGESYYYSLPNKLFNYIHAQVPVLVSDLPEIKNIMESYDIGKITTSRDPLQITAIINEMMDDHKMRAVWKSNLKKAARELCWEKEKDKLTGLYRSAGLNLPEETVFKH